MAYCEWISFSGNSRFSFAKSGSKFLVYTDLTSMVSFFLHNISERLWLKHAIDIYFFMLAVLNTCLNQR